VRLGIAFTVASAIGLFTLPGASAGDEPVPQLWDGAGGLVVPLDDPTPVRIDLLKADFTAVPPAGRKLEDPRFAELWEVSTRMELTNGSAAPCTLTLGLPQRTAADPDAPAAIEHVVISLDHRRMRIERVDQPGPVLPGAPPLEVHHKVSINFDPGQTRRVDTLFQVRAPFADGATRFRFVTGGASLFAGGKIGEAGFEWHFGERVRLAKEDGSKTAWVANPPAGSKNRFFDAGRKSRLLIEIEELGAPATLELAAAAVGLGRDRSDPILGQMRPLESMSALELELARGTYLALYGRMFRDEGLRKVFEDRPWSDCNPAYRVAHGVEVTESSLEEFLAAHQCDSSCTNDREQPVDPYGSAWDEPLCWYALEHNLSLTQVTDPEIKQRIRAIETQQQEQQTPETVPATDSPADSGCLCHGAGRQGAPRPGVLSVLLSTLRGLD